MSIAYVSLPEAAQLLNVTPETVMAYCSRGRLQGVKRGRFWVAIDPASVERFIQERAANLDRIRLKPQARVDPGIEKVCKRCGTARSIELFNKDARYVDGLQPWCKVCYAEYRKQPEERTKQHKRYKIKYADPKYREGLRERQNACFRKRYHTDPDFKQHKAEQKSMINHGRRSRKRKGDLTAAQWKAICAKYGNKCLCCGSPEVHLDHIKPLSRGGEHTASNVQPLCGSCNSRKMTKTIDYRPDGGGKVYQQETMF
jgi:5-methylcytosine-specific restriction endonuclease McrA